GTADGDADPGDAERRGALHQPVDLLHLVARGVGADRRHAEPGALGDLLDPWDVLEERGRRPGALVPRPEADLAVRRSLVDDPPFDAVPTDLGEIAHGLLRRPLRKARGEDGEPEPLAAHEVNSSIRMGLRNRADS